MQLAAWRREERQAALEAYPVTYNTQRPQQERGIAGRTPWRVLLDRFPNDNPQEDNDRQTDQSDAA
jgi:hypothetical protein